MMSSYVSNPLHSDAFPASESYAGSALVGSEQPSAAERAESIRPTDGVNFVRGALAAFGFELFAGILLYGLWEVLHLFR